MVATALFWFAFSLPTNGLFLLLTRTFFSLQRPWIPTGIAAVNLAVSAVAALASTTFGVGGIVASTAIAHRPPAYRPGGDPAAPARRPRAGRLLSSAIRITLAAAALAGVS